MTQGSELVTAYTNLGICLVALLFGFLAGKERKIFFWLSGAGLVGFLAHGLVVLGPGHPVIYPFVWAVVTAAMTGACVSSLSLTLDRRFQRIVLLAGVAVLLVYDLLHFCGRDIFILPVAFDGACLALSSVLAVLARPKKFFLLTGNLLVIAGGLLQAIIPRSMDLIWRFNPSGIAHLLILLAIPFFYWSVKRERR